MKCFLLGISVLLTGISLNAQTVENIQVEQDEDKILIHYRIGGATSTQIYKVDLTCRVDGGKEFIPKTVRGDVGENILGGKSNYEITWDVFEDREEIGEVEFFIKVELVENLSPNYTGPPDPFPLSALFAYNGSIQSPIGFSTGIFKKWGGYVSVRGGNKDRDFVWHTFVNVMGGATGNMVKRGNYRLYAYTGAGLAAESYYEYDENEVVTYSSDDFDFAVEAGIMNMIKWFHLSVGMEYITGKQVGLVFGMGFILASKRR